MKYSDFVKAHRDLLAQSKTVDVEYEDERVLLIHETDWARVLFAYNQQSSDIVKLIVEVSFPAWVQDLSLTGAPNERSPDHTLQLQTVLHEQIHHLEYLLKLSEAGFSLTIIPEEGFWSAWTLLEDTPSRDLFLLLSPLEG